MLVIEIEFLAGRYVASCWNDRDAPEWPPHPARLFSAVVAASHDAGGPDATELRALEWFQALPAPAIAASEADVRPTVPVFVPVNDTSMGSAGPRKETTVANARRRREAAGRLQDLLGGEVSDAELCEALEATIPVLGREPKQHAERLRDSIRRAAANSEREVARDALLDALPKETKDATKAIEDNLKDARSALPLYRPRKERKFPSVTPHDAQVQLVWKDAIPDETIRGGLLKAVSRVSYLGHSSSLVRCALVDDARKPTWVPDDAGGEVLRVPGPDQLADLEAAFALHCGRKPRVLPCWPQRYRYVADDGTDQKVAPGSRWFGTDWIVFQHVGGPVLPIERAVDISSALKAALVDICNEPEFIERHGLNPRAPVPQAISGLTDEGQPLQRPHVAFAALPFVAHLHADGHIMGVAAILPHSLKAAERRAVLAALGQVKTLKLASGLAWMVRRLTPALTRPLSLEPSRWCRGAPVWATVTPILLDRFPGNLGAHDPKRVAHAETQAKEILRQTCERVGLPSPQTVEIVVLPPFRGVPAATRFQRFSPKASRPRRVAVHAVLDFGVPIEGPALLGAGRYLGLGLCRPVTERDQ